MHINAHSHCSDYSDQSRRMMKDRSPSFREFDFAGERYTLRDALLFLSREDSDSAAENPARPFHLNPQARANTPPPPGAAVYVRRRAVLLARLHRVPLFSILVPREPRPPRAQRWHSPGEKRVTRKTKWGFTSGRTNSGDDGKSRPYGLAEA
jgi:hypothetical protein